MSFEAISWAFQQKTAKATEKYVLISLANRANKAGEIWPSIKSISADTQLNRKTVISSLHGLVEQGFLSDTFERKGSTSQVKVYKIKIERDPKTGALKSPKNGTLKESQKRDTIKSERVPFLPRKSPKNGTLKESQKRDTEPVSSLEPVRNLKRIKNTCPVGTEREVKNNSVSVDVINHLNATAGKTFRASAASMKPISGRISEGYSKAELELVIDHKTEIWSKDPRMREYIRPSTIFGKEKFDGYLQAAIEWDKNGRQAHERNQYHNSYQQPKLSTVERNSQQCREYEQRLLREIAELEAEENRGASDSLVVANG